MKPMFTEDDRIKIVRNFILLRGKGEIPISDFSALTRYFHDDKIKLLRPVVPTGRQIDPNSIRSVTSLSPPTQPQYFTYVQNADAEEYFNWLIMIITAGIDATDEVRTEAYDQMFLFIFALREKIRIDLDMLLKVSFEWEDRINAFDHELIDLKERFANSDRYNDRKHDELSDDLDCETKKIADTLEKIGNWQKEYQPYLNKLKKEQDGIGKALKGNADGKKKLN